ncbi:MAG TPA: NAD(P)/FAD-dependent oxidoreductase [Dehalococcoidia bacterium]|nr:NAD(P)/FAD-dependent oxidoreductase [Dehalococcoidia bacterium]
MQKTIMIIGAGLAGLSVGCYGQMNDYNTRIFEMHDKPRGLCTSWKRKGYTFDGCIHWLMGSGSGNFHRLYEELGAVQGRRMINHDEWMRFEGLEGETFIVYTNLERLEQHMKELSPSDASVIEELCNTARSLTPRDLPVEKPAELMGLSDLLKVIKAIPIMRVIRQYSKISNQDYASRFSNPFLREVFPLILDDMPNLSLMAVLWLLTNSHIHNAGWPVGGSLEFARSIEKRYLSLGGEVQYHAPVEKILVENDRAIGVRLADGTEHHADLIVSTADGHTTIFDMLDGKYVNDEIRSYYNEWPIYQPMIQISLGVARDFSNEPRSVKILLEEPINVGNEVRSWLHFHHYCHDPAMAPPGKSVVVFEFLNNDYAYWKELYEDRERYKAEKERLANAVIDQLERCFPGVKDEIEVVDVATPVTYERYTGTWQGSYMGWADTTGKFGKSMSRTLPGLGSFSMAGQWVYFGGGVPGAVMSGRHLIQIICKEDKKKFVTSAP